MSVHVKRYIVGGDPRLIKPFLGLFTADSTMIVHSVVRDGRGDPERLVVSMDPARAAAFEAALGPAIIIEPDELLNPLGGT
ncbi:hypothetical protein [Arthrobacter sp.]|uniref:hypothetical protein n=1 Tax=Arthrobacter sp. TaxID=1667 RepID=UPI0026E0AD8F|nr:hypothetical protein [Arthrobacter sp.]MDO5751719.1 hypothetical protein [Arthrobacter sp.]